VRTHWWVQYELAARKIQRQFRCWNTARHFRRNYSRKLKIESQHNSTFPGTEDSFRNIISEEYSFEDKMALWRGAIELRRAHKVHNTDLIVRALIESAGEIGRATVLLGTREFAMVHKQEIPAKLRRMFMPKMVTTAKQPSAHHELMMSSLRKTLNLNEFNGEVLDTGGTTRLNNINLIRTLRGTKGKQITYQQDREEQRLELFSILNSTLDRSYFSRNHIGNKDFKKNQKLPSHSTAKSKEWIGRFDEVLFTENLHYLLHKQRLTQSS